MRNRTILCVFTLLLSITTLGQSHTDQTESKDATAFTFQRIIQLEDSKKNETIIISIAEDTKEFKLQIDSSVSFGKVSIEIFDANGKKQGTFSVGTQLNNENAELASGTIHKSLLEPDEGDWIVKITSQNAKGIININTLSRS